MKSISSKADVFRRPMTDKEIASLRERLAVLPETFAGRRDLLVMIAYSTGVLAIVGTLAWQLVAWVLRQTLDLEFGWNHSHGWLIFWSIVGASFLYMLITFLRAGWPDRQLRRKLEIDLENRHVQVEVSELVRAMYLREPEHGGRICFLETTDGRVYVSYDHESQDLGVAGDDVDESRFQPRTKLTRSLTPTSHILLDEKFSGEPLQAAEVIEIKAPPEDWPEDGAFIDIPWQEIERRFCS